MLVVCSLSAVQSLGCVVSSVGRGDLQVGCQVPFSWQVNVMISVPVVDMSGATVGTYEFDPAELCKGINKQMLHDVCVMYATNQRVGSVRTKTRGEVSGSTKKLFKQKGTGNARVGTKRSPIRRHGGHAFAKRPKDWSYRMPKKMLRAATRMALLSKFQDGEAVVLSDLKLSTEKTKVVANVLKALGVADQTCLLAIKEHDPVVWKCSRNIGSLWVSPGADLNAYDLLHQKRLVITRDAMDEIRSRSKAAGAGGPSDDGAVVNKAEAGV